MITPLNFIKSVILTGKFKSWHAMSAVDFHVPTEYLTNIYIRDKLAPIKLNRYGEDLLFFLFYMNGGDVLQLASATELYVFRLVLVPLVFSSFFVSLYIWLSECCQTVQSTLSLETTIGLRLKGRHRICF